MRLKYKPNMQLNASTMKCCATCTAWEERFIAPLIVSKQHSMWAEINENPFGGIQVLVVKKDFYNLQFLKGIIVQSRNIIYCTIYTQEYMITKQHIGMGK